MIHATLMDVFNAAGRAAAPFLQADTERLKNENDLLLNSNMAVFRTDLDEKIRRTQYDGDFDKYQGILENFTNEQFNLYKSQNSSPYYQKSIDHLRAQTQEIVRNRALAEDGKWRVDQADIRIQSNMEKHMELPPDLALRAISNEVDIWKNVRPVSAKDEHAVRQKFETAYYQKHAAGVLGAVKDVNGLDNAMAYVREAFASHTTSVPVLDEAGNVTGQERRPWGFEGRKEWEDSLVAQEVKRIQGERFENFREKQAQMDRMVVSGDIDRAINFAKIHGAEWNKYYNPKNGEFANSNQDFRDRGSGFFDWKKLEGYLKQGKGENTAKAMSLLEFYGLEMFIRPQLKDGDGNVPVGHSENGTPIVMNYKSLKEALQGFIHYKREAFMATKGGENAFTLQLWEKEQAEWFKKYYDEVGKALTQLDPSLAGEFAKLRKVDTYITDKKSEFYNDKIAKLSGIEKDQYAQRCINFFESIFFNGITDAPTIKQMMRDYTGSEIMRLLPKQNKPSEEGNELKQLKAFSDTAMGGKAEDIIFKKYNPERLGLSGRAPESTYVFRTTVQQEAVEDIRNREQARVAFALCLPEGDLKPDWMSSPRRNDDVIPKGIFVVSEGEHSGTYYLDYDDNANPIVMKQSGAGWVEYKKTERALTKQETLRQHEQTMNDYTQTIRQGKNPLTGEKLNYRDEPPPGSTYTKAQWDDPRYRVQKDVVWAQYFMRQEQKDVNE